MPKLHLNTACLPKILIYFNENYLAPNRNWMQTTVSSVASRVILFNYFSNIYSEPILKRLNFHLLRIAISKIFAKLPLPFGCVYAALKLHNNILGGILQSTCSNHIFRSNTNRSHFITIG